ncbi:hypothetical protein [Paenibacillus alkalitolerans]|uniref:hypothetical protein n=1 Tax=Paenibacillus alkalitolerans TaxID=2799335 RepID=UPI0018F5F802|nr:hypothetical protein [Paenibacillus alkalitolerans]
MEHQIEFKLQAMAKAQEQLARIIRSESFVVMHMAQIACSIPDNAQTIVGGAEPFPSSAQLVTKQISGYLHTLAELEEALADNLKPAVKELRVVHEE